MRYVYLFENTTFDKNIYIGTLNYIPANITELNPVKVSVAVDISRIAFINKLSIFLKLFITLFKSFS